MLGAIRFKRFPDAAPALEHLRARGLRTVVVSNWDCSLGEVLAEAGLRGLVDGVVTSAEVGAAKPDQRIFDAALALAGSDAAEAVYVGDSPANDIDGAAAAGIRAVLIERVLAAPPSRARIASLAELPSVLFET